MNKIKSLFMGSDKKVFRNFLISYILIFTIPIILLTIVFFYVRGALEHNLENKVEASMNIAVEQMKGIVDDKLEISRALSYTAWNLEGVNYYRKNVAETGAVDLYRLSRQLKAMITGTNFVDDMTLVINTADICINTEGVFSRETLYERLAGNNQEKTLWERELNGFTAGHLVRSGEYGKLYFVQTFPIAKRGEHNEGVFIVEFSHNISESITRILKDMPGMELFLIKEDGTLSFKEGSNEEDHLDRTNTQDWLMVTKPSEQISVQYAAAYQKSVMKSEFLEIERVAMILYVIFIAVGCAAIYYVTLRNYNPIKQLFVLVNGGQPVVSRLLDPYAEIRVKLLEAADKKMMESGMEERQEEIRKRKRFFSMLRDRTVTDRAVEEEAAKLDGAILKSELCMIKVKYADGGSYFNKEQVKELDKGQACANVCDTLLSGSFKNIAFVHRSNIYLLVLLTENEIEVFHTAVREELSKIRHFLQDSYDVDTIASVSDIHKGIKGLRKAIDEVDQTMEAMELTGTRVFLKYSGIAAMRYKNELQITASKEEVQLMNSMKTGDYAKAKTIFNEMMEEYSVHEEGTLHLLKFQLYALVGNIIKFIPYTAESDLNADLPPALLERELAACSTITDFKTVMGKLFDSLERQALLEEAEHKVHFKTTVMELVNANYSNPDLNVSMIANIVNRNLDYVSRMFKKEAGIGLLDYIHEVRITKARELLREQKLTIQQISSMVGYSNCESFIRVFKRKEGITPGRYREQMN